MIKKNRSKWSMKAAGRAGFCGRVSHVYITRSKWLLSWSNAILVLRDLSLNKSRRLQGSCLQSLIHLLVVSSSWMWWMAESHICLAKIHSVGHEREWVGGLLLGSLKEVHILVRRWFRFQISLVCLQTYVEYELSFISPWPASKTPKLFWLLQIWSTIEKNS